MSESDKPLVWLHGEVRTPPMSPAARVETGFLLRQLQAGDLLGMPHSRPMPSIGSHVHELRLVDAGLSWRVVYRLDPDSVVIADVFAKKTQETPKAVIDNAKRRLSAYDAATRKA